MEIINKKDITIICTMSFFTFYS